MNDEQIKLNIKELDENVLDFLITKYRRYCVFSSFPAADSLSGFQGWLETFQMETK